MTRYKIKRLSEAEQTKNEVKKRRKLIPSYRDIVFSGQEKKIKRLEQENTEESTQARPVSLILRSSEIAVLTNEIGNKTTGHKIESESSAISSGYIVEQIPDKKQVPEPDTKHGSIEPPTIKEEMDQMKQKLDKIMVDIKKIKKLNRFLLGKNSEIKTLQKRVEESDVENTNRSQLLEKYNVENAELKKELVAKETENVELQVSVKVKDDEIHKLMKLLKQKDEQIGRAMTILKESNLQTNHLMEKTEEHDDRQNTLKAKECEMRKETENVTILKEKDEKIKNKLVELVNDKDKKIDEEFKFLKESNLTTYYLTEILHENRKFNKNEQLLLKCYKENADMQTSLKAKDVELQLLRNNSMEKDTENVKILEGKDVQISNLKNLLSESNLKVDRITADLGEKVVENGNLSARLKESKERTDEAGILLGECKMEIESLKVRLEKAEINYKCLRHLASQVTPAGVWGMIPIPKKVEKASRTTT